MFRRLEENRWRRLRIFTKATEAGIAMPQARSCSRRPRRRISGGASRAARPHACTNWSTSGRAQTTGQGREVCVDPEQLGQVGRCFQLITLLVSGVEGAPNPTCPTKSKSCFVVAKLQRTNRLVQEFRMAADARFKRLGGAERKESLGYLSSGSIRRRSHILPILRHGKEEELVAICVKRELSVRIRWRRAERRARECDGIGASRNPRQARHRDSPRRGPVRVRELPRRAFTVDHLSPADAGSLESIR